MEKLAFLDDDLLSTVVHAFSEVHPLNPWAPWGPSRGGTRAEAILALQVASRRDRCGLAVFEGIVLAKGTKCHTVL